MIHTRIGYLANAYPRTKQDQQMIWVTGGMYGVGQNNLGSPGYGINDPALVPGNNLTAAAVIYNDGDNIEKVEQQRYAKAHSHEDWTGAFQCTRTGYWAPARFKVMVKGRPYIDEFAPTYEEARYTNRFPRNVKTVG